MNAILVLSTVDSADLGQQISANLVESGLAACVSIIPNVRSVYRWKGKVCDEGEWLLVIKTTSEVFEAVRERIRQLHTYQVPEILAIPVSSGDADYLAWMGEQIRQS